MKTAGIIAEYNPFHNGHKFHIEETRRQTSADYVIAAMSGDFVQRGTPAILDKYTRAKMALEHGVDLVIELPLTAAVSSAEAFATGGISLFDQLSIVDEVSFGCESAGSPDVFSKVADILIQEPSDYRQQLAHHLRNGLPYPKARELALQTVAPDCLDPTDSWLCKPNNILALEYVKALHTLKSHMKACVIPRKSSDYNSTDIQGSFCSATAVRKVLTDPEESLQPLQAVVPPSVFQTLEAFQNSCQMENDYSSLLHYALVTSASDLWKYGSENTDLANRIQNSLEHFESWTQFTALLKSKNQTFAGISRFLCQVLLKLTREHMQLAAAYHYAPYARILGFRREAAPLLKQIHEHARIPVLTSLANDRKSLPEEVQKLLDLDILASDIYNSVGFHKTGHTPCSDYRQPLIIL